MTHLQCPPEQLRGRALRRYGLRVSTALLTTSILFCVCDRSHAMSPAEAEASAAARNYWQKVLVKCGADYYKSFPSSTPSKMKLFDYKGVTFRTKLEPVLPVDHLNGIDWEAESEMNYRFARSSLFSSDGSWGDWWPGDAENNDRVSIEKRSGVLAFSPAPPDSPPTCADLPK